MTIEETRQKVVSQIGELNRIEYPRPTAMDLRGSRPLMNRVERQGQRLYKQKIAKQQKDFQLKLAKIDKYYADLKVEEQRRLDLLAAYEDNKELTLLSAPVFQPIELVIPKPVISVPGMPVQRRARLYSRARERRLRRFR